MRASVEKTFRDKVAMVQREPKDEFTLTRERFDELSAAGYVSEIAEETSTEKEDKPATQRTTKEEKSAKSTKS